MSAAPGPEGVLCILSCHGFAAEVAAAIRAEGWTDVVAAGFPVRCGRPGLGWEEVRPLVPEHCTQVVLLGRACIRQLGSPPPGFPPVRLEVQSQCFHMVAPPPLVDEAITTGAYLITSAWLSDWQGELRKLGFEPEQARDFFRDFASEVLLLDTGLDPDAPRHLAELEALLGLPARRLVVGVEHLRLVLARLVSDWRLEQFRLAAREQARRHAAELADYVAAMDLLTRLARTQTEADTIHIIEDLFQMLFAPAALHYLRIENDIPVPFRLIPEDVLKRLDGLRGDHAWLPDGKGFLLRISHGEEPLGLIAVEGLAFPEYRQRYLNLALSLTGVCGLAIINARNQRRLLEAEKMASLSILVAGVAHEINTPLGVGLAAASTLQEQSQRLAGQFAARSMTQSDLTHYLENAAASTALVRTNLERIAHLITAFREVAVEGGSRESHTFSLRGALENIVQSLGDRLRAQGVMVRIECDPDLTVHGSQEDWGSIFTNLIGNSLKHGFRDRDAGNIHIKAARDERKWLRIDYRDDGCGVAGEVLARIFDPFFSTDLQRGMGLGLHLVYNLITHRMRGQIQCASTPGEGVHFHVEIPGASS